MPKDKVEAAIARATGQGSDANYEEALYEGYAPHGIALLVVAATDNPTRTVANVRVCFNKCGGTLGNSGSVAFLFNKVGFFQLRPDGVDRESLELELIDYGLEELTEGTGEKGDPVLIARCGFTEFGRMANFLEAQGAPIVSSGLEHVPLSTTELSDEQTDDVLKLIARLEDDDDVQAVYHNMG
jgi:YebC/PmpR family DNA-binding regulatory protein